MEEIKIADPPPDQYAQQIDFEQCDAVEPTEDSS